MSTAVAAGASTREDWQAFVLHHGWRVPAHHLARVLGVDVRQINGIRQRGGVRAREHALGFAALFSLWHGRPPLDDEWPVPQLGGGGQYEWLGPEVALLASLVGQIGVPEIAQVLTARLRQLTGDDEAERSAVAVQNRIARIGLQTSDVVGGVSVMEAAKEAGGPAVVRHAIRTGALRARRVGRLLVIDHAAWAAWKAQRSAIPAGHVRLSTLREPLGIESDKLSEFARMGHVPGAVRIAPFGEGGASTQFGSWFVPESTAAKLLADRRAGRPMPWHGQAIVGNLQRSYALWTERRHPASCATCAQIWGQAGAPTSFDAYVQRYPSLAHGAKRHLTMAWSPGLTVAEVAAQAGVNEAAVRLAIDNGVLDAQRHGRRVFVTRTNATRWIARRCPSGEGGKSWASLDLAMRLYLFTADELEALIANGTLRTKTGTAGAARGVRYVLKHQCGQWRAKQGFTETEAARRVGVSVAQLRVLLEGVAWRQEVCEGIPLVTVQAVIKRMQSSEGWSVEEAAIEVGKPIAWVRARIEDGTVKLRSTRWNPQRPYLSAPMMRRLREAAAADEQRQRLDPQQWLRVSDAARLAGVSTLTLTSWVTELGLERQRTSGGWRYDRESVMAFARRYWVDARWLRERRPAWLQAESRAECRAECQDEAGQPTQRALERGPA